MNSKSVNSNDNSRQIPRKSQWATLRSLRKASMYHYNQFAKATADSTLPETRRLRKSYVTAKNMLEMGILTFRDVLHGQTPTTLMDIFAFASLSYVISKTLHANGHIEESDILSGILDWRAAIIDESERSAFDEIAKQLWPEAKEIMHFFPIGGKDMNLETTGLRRDESETRLVQSSIPREVLDAKSSRRSEEHIASQEYPLLSPSTHEYTPISQANTFPAPCAGELLYHTSGLQDHVRQLFQETKSHEEFLFSAFLNLPEDPTDPSLHQTTILDFEPEVPNPSQTGCLIDIESTPSELRSSPLHNFEEPSPFEYKDAKANGSAPHRLLNTTLFQVVSRFVIHVSEMGDLLNVLSGGGLTSGAGGIKPAHPRQPWATFEFLDQAPEHIFRPLHHEAVQIDEAFCGIVTMAEMFVKLGSLQTVREVENYIITVGRYLTRSYDLFVKLVSKTLIQCLFASQKMKWNLLYPNRIQEADEYSIEYIDRRERGEKKWADSSFAHLDLSEDMPSPSSSTNDDLQKHSPNPLKHFHQGKSNSAAKRHRRKIPDTASQGPVSGSDVSTIELCPFDNCSKSYTGSAARNNLSRHVRTEHLQKKTLNCPNCCKGMRRRDNLRQHFLKVHSTHTLPDWIANKGRGLRDARHTD
ncbi:Uncharacterized protein BP5553_07328 [Venustampulla echinocandica]|uniref:C2H2-type domain-containing protein n=1 Tax=Venustampulla echinocandica TaxID=2656787 RepID=A0A370TJ62_9HELO|nr:Uncharacterized protein BP5553_07328 [Venustampulla echinocandica]RDL35397.1 Uncharacterized protein BP5553_07328 [Venustampulla echinocandica]